MELKKITIIGNSVALRNRPHHGISSLNYGQIIEKELNSKAKNKIYYVNNVAFGRALTIDLYDLQDEIINSFPDLYIINMGVCDAATREMPLWMSNILTQKKPSFIKLIMKGFNIFFFKKFRRILVLLRGKRTWVNKNKFKKAYKDTITVLEKNTSAKIICLSILKPNEKVERQIPGSTKSYVIYNKIIQEICDNSQALFIDIPNLNSKEHYPDGTHYNEKGNQIVAEYIISKIEEGNLI